MIRTPLGRAFGGGRDAPPRFPLADMPAAELERLRAEILAAPEVLDTEQVRAAHLAGGATVLADPFAGGVADLAVAALRAGAPFSAIRIGDGEAAFLALDERPDLPHLVRHCFEETVRMQADRLDATEAWMAILGEAMHAAVAEADVIGALGLWRPDSPIAMAPQDYLPQLDASLRGAAGHWLGRDLMLRRSRAGALEGRTLASAHLYFGVAARVHDLVSASDGVLCVTDRARVVEALRRRHPGKTIDLIAAGGTKALLRRGDGPDFLARLRDALPDDLSGRLCLIGAGPWAEFCCTWARRRGGVALDLGSGFDLLDGARTRPIHATIPQEARAAIEAAAVS